MGKLILIITLLYVSFVKGLLKDEWVEFIQKHDKFYEDPLEEKLRMYIFAANKEIIDRHNVDYELGKTSFKMKMNHFGDLMPHEFNSMMKGYNRNITHRARLTSHSSLSSFKSSLNIQIPESIDWRANGAVTPVKNQGHCGSCWSFSATGALEGQHFRKTGKLLSLSEQNLMDCSISYGNNGCGGGLTELAFQYISDNHGIDSESGYPYEAKDGVCRYNPNMAISSDVGYFSLPSGDEETLKIAVATIGPISVAIDATTDKFKFYSEGVYDNPECSSTDLDHAVLVVGYNMEANGENYWLVKNSWGSNWGENGYVKMQRNRNNKCGIASEAIYPLV